MAGKGDTQRPMQISYDEYEKNWNLIFGKKPKKGKKDGTQPMVETSGATAKPAASTKNA